MSAPSTWATRVLNTRSGATPRASLASWPSPAARVMLVGVHGMRDALLSEQRGRRGATSCHGQSLWTGPGSTGRAWARVAGETGGWQHGAGGLCAGPGEHRAAAGPARQPAARGFVAALDPVNAAADAAPGFVWRLQTEDGNATSVRAFEWDQAGGAGVIVNLSVWESPEALRRVRATPTPTVGCWPSAGSGSSG